MTAIAAAKHAYYRQQTNIFCKIQTLCGKTLSGYFFTTQTVVQDNKQQAFSQDCDRTAEGNSAL